MRSNKVNEVEYDLDNLAEGVEGVLHYGFVVVTA